MWNVPNRCQILIIIGSIFIFLFLLPGSGFSAQIRLAWDANTESNLLGYKVYYGTISKSYINSVDIGNEISFTLTGLAQGQAYFIVVTAYDNLYYESVFSLEVNGVAMELEPPPPSPPPTITPIPIPTPIVEPTLTPEPARGHQRSKKPIPTPIVEPTPTPEPARGHPRSKIPIPTPIVEPTPTPERFRSHPKGTKTRMYLAVSAVDTDGSVIGNLKSYEVTTNSTNVVTTNDTNLTTANNTNVSTVVQVIDATQTPVLDSNGLIKETSKSYWSSEVDGKQVDKGGLGEVLLSRTKPRNIITNVEGDNLMSGSNEFAIDNDKLTPELLGLAPKDTVGRGKLIQFVHGYDAYSKDKERTSLQKRKWILGPIINSRPLVISYESLQSVVFVGANDGMLHAFDTMTGEELWGFIPYELLGRLKELSQSKSLKYFVDGPPKAYITRSQKIIVFGLRRGGSHYYALDVTDPEKPKFLWKIGPETEGFSEMGQTWSTPQIGKIKVKSGERAVCFIGAGYDESQDRKTLGIDDKKGRAVYAVDIMTGTQIWRWDYEIDPTMKYTIPSEISLVDTDGDGYIDRLYAGDTGGRLWRIDIKSPDLKEWAGRVIFNSNPDSSGWRRKVFFRPDVTLEKGYEMVFFGTGDQVNKDEMKIVNQIYAIKDNGLNSTVSINDLKNVTKEIADPKDMDNKRGWFISLENKGEKVLASSNVLFGVVYFTSFTPSKEGATEGVARIYALDYKTGGPILDLNPANNLDGMRIDLSDRSKVIGNGFPSNTVISALDGKLIALTGFSRGVYHTPLKKNSTIIPISWKEVAKKK